MKKTKSKFTQEYLNKKNSSGASAIVHKATVDEILNIAKKELHKPIKELVVLDVGSGFGEYSFEIEKYVKKIVGVEPFEKAFNIALENKKKRKSKVEFHNLLVENFNTEEKFDLAISLTVLEHMSDPDISFRKVLSLLRPGGILYVTAPNKWWPFELHYHLFFLGWLPLFLANFYVRIMGKGLSFQGCSSARSYFGMKKLFNQFACTYYFFLPSNNAIYLGLGKGGRITKFIRGIGIALIRKVPLFWTISKGFIMVVKKNYKKYDKNS